MLRSSLDSKSISVDKFSRWLRALCTILLARNKEQDRAKSLSFIEQAVEVIKENKDETGGQVCPTLVADACRLVQSINHLQVYAHDEREWLLHISFNTGVERFV